ncbi:MAG: hypothetical protein ACLSFT_08500 [Ruminococcus callidus]
MVKGVQKKIIEVNRPDSLYFERAVFYLKPGVTSCPSSFMDADALLREANERAENVGSGRSAGVELSGTAAVCLLVL